MRIVLAAKVMRPVDAFLHLSEPIASHPQDSGRSPGPDDGPESSPMQRGRFSVHASGRESQRHPRQLEIGDLLAHCVLKPKVVRVHLYFSLQLRAGTCCQKSLRILRRRPVLLNIFHYLLFVEFLFCIIFQTNACALSRRQGHAVARVRLGLCNCCCPP